MENYGKADGPARTGQPASRSKQQRCFLGQKHAQPITRQHLGTSEWHLVRSFRVRIKPCEQSREDS
jgi:hypothetical protein